MKTFSILAFIIPAFVVGALVLSPAFAGAQQGSVNPGFPQGSANPTFQGTAASGPLKFENPLRFDSFCTLIKGVLSAVIAIGIPVAVLFLVWVGFKFVLAQGNPEKLKEAQRNFFATVIGIALFLGAWTIAQLLIATVQQFGTATFLSCQ